MVSKPGNFLFSPHSYVFCDNLQRLFFGGCNLEGDCDIVCMAFPLTHVYLLTSDKSRELCAAVGVESMSTVQVLRRKLLEILKADEESDSRGQTADETARARANGGP
jgi:hypothetical protein